MDALAIVVVLGILSLSAYIGYWVGYGLSVLIDTLVGR